MRILFAFVGGRGHLEPLLPIAAAAAAAGHEVAFAGQAAMAAEVEAESFTAFAAGPPTLRTTKAPLLVPDQAFEDGVVRDHFAGTIARGRAEDLIALGQRWPPDLIVADQMDFGALLAAERLGVPRAIVGVIASGVFGGADLVGDTLNGLRAELGLAADPDMAMLERDLVLLPIPPRFLSPTAKMSPTTHFIRPAVLEPAAAPMSPARRDRPLVYVTLGTIFNLESGDLFARAISAVRDLAVDVIVTIGPHLDPLELGAQPANVRIVPFIPQATILPDCDVVVCHGGSGTVIGALCYGVPLVLLAMGADQLHNAERAATLGVAIALDVITATVDDIGSAVLTLLSDPIYRERARAFREEAAGLPDARHTVGLLEALVERRGRPVRVRTLSPDEWALLRDVRLRA